MYVIPIGKKAVILFNHVGGKRMVLDVTRSHAADHSGGDNADTARANTIICSTTGLNLSGYNTL